MLDRARRPALLHVDNGDQDRRGASPRMSRKLVSAVPTAGLRTGRGHGGL